MDKAEIILFYDTATDKLEQTNREVLTVHAEVITIKVVVDIDVDYDMEDGQYIFCGSVSVSEWYCEKYGRDIHTLLEHVAPEFLEKLEALVDEFVQDHKSDFVEHGKLKGR